LIAVSAAPVAQIATNPAETAIKVPRLMVRRAGKSMLAYFC